MMSRSLRSFAFAFLVKIFFVCDSGYAVTKISEMNSEMDRLRSKFEDISARLESLQKRLIVVEGGVGEPVAESKVEEVQLVHESEEQEESPESDNFQKEEENQGGFEKIKTIKEGYYIAPFLGVMMGHELRWKSIAGDFEVDGGGGVSSGVRVGYNFRNFFADLQISYFKNELKSINVPQFNPLLISGDVDGVGFHFSGGGRLNLSESFSARVGVGLGGVHQDVSFMLFGNSVNEKNSLLSAQLFTGLEYRPFEEMILGLNYRFLYIEGMDSFHSRNLHLAELSAGYIF